MNRRTFLAWLLATASVQSNASEKSVVKVLVGIPSLDSWRDRKIRLHANKNEHVVATVGRNGFLISPDSEVEFETDATDNLSVIRLFSGAIHSVFDPNQSSPRLVETQFLQVAIRGTGHYCEIQNDEQRTYSCCCYGNVHLSATKHQNTLDQAASYHEAKVIGVNGIIEEAPYKQPLNHYDDSLIFLENLFGRQPHWSLPNNQPNFFAPFDLKV